MNVSPGIIFISPGLNKQKPWRCINYPQGSYFVIWNVNPPTILNVFFYLTIVTVSAFTFFSFIGIFESAYPKATQP